jgi:hypothetical protein
VYAEQQQPVAAAPAAAGIGRWRGSWTDDEHAAAVAVVREAIARGDVYQANVVAHRSAAFTGDPAAVSALLGAVRRTPYSGSLSGDGWSVHSASPECLLEVTSGRVLTRPIKGTAPRGADTDADAAARAELLASGEGPRGARHDRRSGAERPGARLPHRQRDRPESVRRPPARRASGTPSRRWSAICAAASGWPTCSPRRSRADR